ncbi:aryl-sulfate sulfotransferase N-terminal domain-containing protein [Bifidobacterium sp.]|jgi:hypothetical protein|uniref:aryl-sulfate sulfotransferase N-terminal domain-containing protein n=1 Tax=Bifidobacterium sp. TaxID=41200 RepID=UPI0025C64634|nr:aryl-sulfate sulfotransferase N-terminal domain-containing protein [Bifidobacterium sp.]MCH4209835.1 aryl-sulfate sulfotransferase N-terminal domain-containing protein [Bifidobacterium sp.]MCI1224156.1 aryl-sulfate sulfotransferase N-terminal domain-containing protein [Bifidobacterium sp.]
MASSQSAQNNAPNNAGQRIQHFRRFLLHTRAGKTLIFGVAVLVLAALVPIVWGPVNSALAENRIEKINDKVAEIYTADYQKQADDALAKDRGKSEHTEDSIYTKENPYGTSTTGLYVYFTTDRPAKISYRVSARHTDYPDFAATPNGGDTYQTTHEFQAIGLIPGEQNNVIITVTYQNGESYTRTITKRSAKA